VNSRDPYVPVARGGGVYTDHLRISSRCYNYLRHLQQGSLWTALVLLPFLPLPFLGELQKMARQQQGVYVRNSQQRDGSVSNRTCTAGPSSLLLLSLSLS